MVYVAIHHHGAADGAIALEDADGHGHVVDGAETFAVAGERVVKSTADVVAHALFERQPRGQRSARGGQGKGFHHVTRIWNFQAQNITVAHGAVAELADPGGIVGQQQVGVGDGAGRNEVVFLGEAGLKHALPQPPVFAGWEHVLAQVQVVSFVIDQPERKHGNYGFSDCNDVTTATL